ncbi:MAG: hypothetical protein ACFHWX_22820 [Bacteroidota bacterium]
MIRKLGFWLLAVVLLRALAVYVTDSSAYFTRIMDEELDPSLMYYTESKEALNAEKIVRHKTRNIRFMTNTESD